MTTKALVRKLLLRVHPDVVASHSKSARDHNETALKSLLQFLDERSTIGSPSIKLDFYTRDGVRTKAVVLSPHAPDRGLRELLGEEQVEEEAEQFTNPISGLGSAKKGEFSRILRETLNEFVSARLDFMGVLFAQNRVRFIADPLLDEDDNDDELTRQAVELVKDTLQGGFVHESTLEALVRAPLVNEVEFIVVGNNLNKVVSDDLKLYVPLKTRPEVFGREIDKLIDAIVEKAVNDQA